MRLRAGGASRSDSLLDVRVRVAAAPLSGVMRPLIHPRYKPFREVPNGRGCHADEFVSQCG